MAKSKPKKPSKPKPEVRFDEANDLLSAALVGSARAEILDSLSRESRFGASLARLRDAMKSHRFDLGANRFDLARIVASLDRQTRREGFHVLRDWDGQTDRLFEETIPVNVVDFMIDRDLSPDSDEAKRTVLGILLDYYFFYLLTLLSMRIWEPEGDADQNLDGVESLLTALQGDKGAGQLFVGTAETLILIATAHFESDEAAFDRLLERVATLNEAHRVRLARAHAPILSSHLRFGFQATYRRDLSEMRSDNIPDYPWLLFAVSTLMHAFREIRESAGNALLEEPLVEGIVNGLSPDPRAFLGAAPQAFKDYGSELEAFRSDFEPFRDHWPERFEKHRPSETEYSPLSFFFNFPHNVLKAIVVDAVVRAEPWPLSLNDLLTAYPKDKNAERVRLAETLMGYARRSPDPIRGRPTPAIVYDPRAGRRTFTDTLKRLSVP